jgi:hypothetical protein
MADEFDIDAFSDYVPSDASDNEESPEQSDNGVQFSSPEHTDEEETGDPNKYSARDFDGIRVSKPMLKRFNDAYDEFLEAVTSMCERDNKEPMLLEKPYKLRVNGQPPQSMQEFMEHMPLIHIDEAAVRQKSTIETRLRDAKRTHAIDRNHEDHDDPVYIKKLQIALINDQIEIFRAVCDGAEKIARQQDWQRLLGLLLVTTVLLFDEHETHLLFSMRAPLKEVQAILNRVGKCWRAVLSKTNAEMGLPEDSDTPEALQKFLGSQQRDLNEGHFSNYEAQYLCQFLEAKFPYKPTNEPEDFGPPSDEEKEKDKAQGVKRQRDEQEGGAKKPKMKMQLKKNFPKKIFG